MPNPIIGSGGRLISYDGGNSWVANTSGAPPSNFNSVAPVQQVPSFTNPGAAAVRATGPGGAKIIVNTPENVKRFMDQGYALGEYSGTSTTPGFPLQNMGGFESWLNPGEYSFGQPAEEDVQRREYQRRADQNRTTVEYERDRALGRSQEPFRPPQQNTYQAASVTAPMNPVGQGVSFSQTGSGIAGNNTRTFPDGSQLDTFTGQVIRGATPAQGNPSGETPQQTMERIRRQQGATQLPSGQYISPAVQAPSGRPLNEPVYRPPAPVVEERNAQGLTMAEANDPKNWQGNVYTPGGVPKATTSPVTPVVPGGTPPAPISPVTPITPQGGTGGTGTGTGGTGTGTGTVPGSPRSGEDLTAYFAAQDAALERYIARSEAIGASPKELAELDAIKAQLRNENLRTEAGLVAIADQPIAAPFLSGQSAALQRQAGIRIGALTNQGLSVEDALKRAERVQTRAAENAKLRFDTASENSKTRLSYETEAEKRAYERAKDSRETLADLEKEKRAAAKDSVEAVNKVRDDAQASLKLTFDTYGADAIKRLSAEEKRKWEKTAELPQGTLDYAGETLKEETLDQKKQAADKGRYKTIAATRYHPTLTLDSQTGKYVDGKGGPVSASVVAKGRTATSTKSTGILTTKPKGFDVEVGKAASRLQKGEDWGVVWNSVKSRFPTVQNTTLDNALGADFWKKPGAFEEYRGKQEATKPKKSKGKVTRETAKYRFFEDGSYESK